MATEGGGVAAATETNLEETPTWALATLCFLFISLGILIEYFINLLCHWLKKHRKTSLFEAVEKLKSVLMLLGFISLILAVTRRPLSKICIPTRVANTMLPCRQSASPTETTQELQHLLIAAFQHSVQDVTHHQRILATLESDPSDTCESRGMTPFISQTGLTQLSIFIFVLAVMQIAYSVATMALGRAKMRRWKSWEKETQSVEYLAANDSRRFRFTRQTTFGRRHMSTCATTAIQLWIKCFFRQFFNSVAKVDYFTLRHGFIAAHLSANKSFNFQKYIQRSLEDDFKAVVGISPFMWFIVVIFLLVDVHGWNVFLWVSFLPLIIVLVIGTKLEAIVARMALRLQDQGTVIRGTPLVQPDDSFFWFNQPGFVLILLHFTLFMNAFEFAFFIWVTWQYGIQSCYHERTEIIVIRVVLAVVVQVLCSYITLPLYALVTQMGSQFKSAVLEEQTVRVIKQWHADVKTKRKKKQYSESPHDDLSSAAGSSSPSTPKEASLNQIRTPNLSEFPINYRSREGKGNEIIEGLEHNETNSFEDSVSLQADDHDHVQVQISEEKN